MSEIIGFLNHEITIHTSPLEILGFLIGLLYLYWEYHANSKVWLASVVMPMISMWIYFSKGLYADFAINIYYLFIAIYGFIVWTRPKTKKISDTKTESQHPITHTPVAVWVGVIGAILLLWWGIWWILVTFTNSTVPIPDAFTTAVSIVGLWMMARKYAEQWLLWFVVDFVCIWLYFYKEIPFYGILYAIYTVISVFGYLKWLRLMKKQNS